MPYGVLVPCGSVRFMYLLRVELRNRMGKSLGVAELAPDLYQIPSEVVTHQLVETIHFELICFRIIAT